MISIDVLDIQNSQGQGPIIKIDRLDMYCDVRVVK